MGLLNKGNYRWLILFITIACYLASQIVRWNYASITGYLVDELHIGKPELGLLGSAFFYAYAVTQIPWGAACDIWGGRRVITWGVFLLSFFLGGFAFATSYVQAVGWRIGMGIVAAAEFVPNMVVLSKWFSKKERAFALQSYAGFGGGLGDVAIFLLTPLIALFLSGGNTVFGLGSWRGATMIMAIIIILVAFFSACFLRSHPNDIGLPSVEEEETAEADDHDYKGSMIQSMKDPALWFMSMCWSGYIVGARLVPGWLPLYGAAYYMETEHMSKEAAAVAAGVIVTMFIIGRMLGTPLVGKLSDYLLKQYGTPRSVLIAAILFLTAVMYYVFTLPMPSVYCIGALSMVSGCLVNSFPLINAACAEIWPMRVCGFNNGIINTIGQFAGASALGASGFWAVKYAVKGGSYFTEFQGIWYLGIIISVFCTLCAFYVVYREKQVQSAHNAKTARTSA
jgi:MFS transporter, OPA family, sugar phosphate sensor protein UhpC